jgi:putative hydrolase of the HAD superfamily
MTATEAPPLRALLLDLGGVAFPLPLEFHRAIERHYGLPPGTLQWRGPFDPAGDALWQEQQAGGISEREYWRLRAEEVERLAGRTGGVREYLTACYQEGDAALRPEMVALVADAQAAGLRVGALTNDAEVFLGRDWLEGSKFLATLDAFVDASTTGILKPDPAAFQLALDALQLNAGEVLFVDDQATHVAAALRVGLPTIHFDVTDAAGSAAQIRRRLQI